MARHYQGRYAKRRKKTPLWVWVVPSLVLVISLLAICGILRDRQMARAAQEQMAASVQQLRESTAPTTQPPRQEPPEAPPEEPVEEPTEAPTESPTEAPEVLPQYAGLYEENQDLVGWLRIEGTAVDYPVMHTPQDPEKYLHRNFQEEEFFAGLPFIDYRCTMESDNLVIYGHNMSDGTMFHSIVNFERKDYWKAHPVICFDTLFQEQEYEVVAAFYDRVYYSDEDVFKFYNFIDAADEEEFLAAIAAFKEKSIYDTGITPEFGQQLITLVTCTYQVENGRFVLVARRK